MTSHPSEWLVGLVLAATAAFGGAAGKAIDNVRARRQNAGTVEVSSADELWTHMKTELERLDARIDTLQSANDALQRSNAVLHESNLRLVHANEGLISANEALQVSNKTLARRNTELVKANEKLEARVEALLSRLGERADDLPPGLKRTPGPA